MNASRKIWTEREDSILTEIILERKVIKWSVVAKIMEGEYDIPGRTGKQCRERWHNQLDPNIKSEKWTDRQEELLYKYHNEFGNKWAKISQFIPGRTDNCVKNHFYSNLRKALRRINLFIIQKKIPGDYRQIRPSILPKVIAIAEERFVDRSMENNISQGLVDKCVAVKNKLSQYCNIMTLEPEDVPALVDLVDTIFELAQVFKHNKASKLIRSHAAVNQKFSKIPTIKSKDFNEENQVNKVDSPGTESMTPEPNQDEIGLMDNDSESMDQPIALFLNNAGGMMELDSPTLPRLKRRLNARLSPCHQAELLDLSEDERMFHPQDSTLLFLNPCSAPDDNCCL